MQAQNTRIIPGAAALLILLFFFMPWVTISCSGTDVSITGYELATGNLSEAESAGASSEETSGDAYLWLVPLTGLIVAGLVAGALSNMHQIENATLGIIFMVTGAIGLIAQIIEYFQLRSDLDKAAQQGYTFAISYELGWWLTLLAFLTIIGSGFMIVSARDAPESLDNFPRPNI